MNKLIELIKKARFIWIVGNGGSAATAEHFATDLVKKGYPAICLNSQNSVITMIANDYGYRNIFAIQLDAYGNENDLLVTISCSGTSQNIVDVQCVALDIGMHVFAFETFSKDKNYAKLEDKHLAFAHKIAGKLGKKK